MPRPEKSRIVSAPHHGFTFKPVGIKMIDLEIISLGLDELEAIRLADLEEKYHQDAANEMHVSRQTFGNILNSARKKIADFIINHKSLTIRGGNIELSHEISDYHCEDCKSNNMNSNK
ncbi:MAG: DUF134 domain-containing protein [Candidatus Kapabacteria bacterium]|nr:DUF134 domain-containing protein [Ignavibacteriota bacterium]MCW5885413.1 DUF134 domain-containing protein [Candidatus Kapabacteria bacterium]